MNFKNLLIASAALVGFVSCDKSEGIDTTLPSDNIIRVSAGVDSPATRAGAETSNLTEFGMFVEANSTTYTYSNVKATKANSTWSTEMMLWKNAADAVDIVAYAPYSASYSTLGEVSVLVLEDQSAEANVVASDFLYAQSSVTPSGTQTTANSIYYDVATKKVKATLAHHFSKLFLTINLGSEFNNVPFDNVADKITNLKINGTNTSATVELSTGAISSPATVAPITPFAGVYTAPTSATSKSIAKYEAIIIPQTLATSALSIEITINGETYTWKSTTEVSFISGKSRTLALNVGNDIVTTEGTSVGDWIDGTGDSIITE